jgi:heat shock protein HtpX
MAIGEPELFYPFLGLELASLALAFSPAGEWLLRVMSGARKIRTERDREYLTPIFESVYEDVKTNNKRISRKIELYIEETKDINAYAFGSNSISVTRGAMENLTEEQLKGVFAHELGHMNNGDTKVTLVMTVGNGAFTVLWLILKSAMRYKNEDLKFVFMFNAMIGFVVRCFTAIGDRHQEYMADEFARDNGYGEGLIETLYFFKELSAGEKMRLRDRLRASHPHLDKRIERLEKLREEEA